MSKSSFARAVLIRCLLLLALLANGVVAPAHAHGVAGALDAPATAVAPGTPPCHEAMSGLDAADSGNSDSAQFAATDADHGCCGSQCACECVSTSALPTLAWQSPLQSTPPGPTGRQPTMLAASTPNPLLRPPIV